MKKKSQSAQDDMAAAPTQKAIERLTRNIWQFGEEVRMRAVSSDEVGG